MKAGHFVIGLSMAAFLAGCASDGNLPKPTPLTKLDSSLDVKRAWHLVNITERERTRLGLDVYVDDSHFLWVDNQGRLHAQDAATGKRLWITALDNRISSAPAIHGDWVYVVTQEGKVVALNKRDGALQWQVHVSSEALVPPQFADGILVVYCVDGKVFGLNASDGAERWHHDSEVPAITLRGNATPTISADGRVLVGLSEGELTALDLWTGQSRWNVSVATPRGRSELDRMVDVDASPVIAGDVVYTAAYQGQVAAFQLETGRVLWSTEMSTAKDIAVADGQVYVADEESVLYALDAQSGRILWKQDALKWRYVTAPVFYKSYIVVGDLEGYLHWLDARSGKLVHRVSSDNFNFDAKPIVVGDRLYAMSRAGIIDVLQLDVAAPANSQ